MNGERVTPSTAAENIGPVPRWAELSQATLAVAATGWRVLRRLPIAGRILAGITTGIPTGITAADGSDEPNGPKLFTVEEVAAVIGVSQRWLADECRANRVTHVHLARKRRFTVDQVHALLDRFTVTPIADRLAGSHRARVMRRLERESGPARTRR
jgi:hypothetical protein